jgi:hypothetical protein
MSAQARNASILQVARHLVSAPAGTNHLRVLSRKRQDDAQVESYAIAVTRASSKTVLTRSPRLFACALYDHKC